MSRSLDRETPLAPVFRALRGFGPGLGAIFVALMLHGCAALMPPETVEQRLERAVAAGDYRSALALLEGLDPQASSPLLEMRADLEAAADQVGTEALAIAQRQAGAGELAMALATLEQARERLPDDARIDGEIETLSAIRLHRLANLGVDYLRLEAEGLLERRRLITDMNRLVADPQELPQTPERVEAQARQLAQTLDAQAMMRTDPAERRGLLRLAEALEPSAERQQVLAALEPRRAAPPAGSAQRRAEELTRALALDDLATAQRICRPGGRRTTDPGLDPLCQDFEQRRAQWLEDRLEEGRRLYATGQIDAAVEHWREAQALAPDHVEIAAALERAARVQERLERLRARSSPEIPEPADTTPD
jgi:tetratricopeptide (TPR) repeat protein